MQLAEAPLFIDDTPGCSIMDIHAKLRRLKAEHGLGLVVIDYLQLMSGKGRSENRNQEVSAISRGLKLLAMELNVPFMVLSQLSRAPETRPGDHKPHDERPARIGIDRAGRRHHRLHLSAKRSTSPTSENLRGLADLILAKQRNGPTGNVKLVFLNQFTRFENRLGDFDAGGE